MRSALERALRASWSGGGGAGGAAFRAAALPAELAFRWVVALRSHAYDSGLVHPWRAPVPTLCVGNLTVGGTGKTPLAGWVIGVLSAAGLRPAIVARGYGRDELLLHRRWHPAVAVHADPDRTAAARAATDLGAEVLVLDDGFQHRQLARDLDLVVVAAEQPFPGPMLPRGPFREPVGALARAHWVVVTRRTASAEVAGRLADEVRRRAPGARLARVRLAPVGWTRLDGSTGAAPRGETLAVAGIAEPRPFADLVEEASGARAELLAFADHHEYTAADVERIRRAADGRPIATTEKDAVKLAAYPALADAVHVVVLGVQVEEGEAALRQALLATAGAGVEHSQGERTS